MVYRPPFIKQLDGSMYAGLNCTMAAGAMAIIRHQRGSNPPGTAIWYPKPYDLRRKTGDTSGGTNLDQLDSVAYRYYGVNLEVRYGLAWETFRSEISKGRGAVLQGSYSVWAGTKYDGSRAGFRGNHAVYVNEVRRNAALNRYEYLVYDPLWDGRRTGIPKGPLWVPESWVSKFAGYLIITGTIRAGVGRAWAAFTRDTEVEPTLTLFSGAIKIVPKMYYSRYAGAVIRSRPFRTATKVATLPFEGAFKAYQRFDKGTAIEGSTVWYGDITGKKWVHSKNLKTTR